MPPLPAHFDPDAIERAAQLVETHGGSALAEAKRLVEEGSEPASIELWSTVCAIFVTGGNVKR